MGRLFGYFDGNGFLGGLSRVELKRYFYSMTVMTSCDITRDISSDHTNINLPVGTSNGTGMLQLTRAQAEPQRKALPFNAGDRGIKIHQEDNMTILPEVVLESSHSTLYYRGGGGDNVGATTVSWNITIPKNVAKMMGVSGLFLTCEVIVEPAPGRGVYSNPFSFYENPDRWALSVDVSDLLDGVVLLASRRYLHNGRIQWALLTTYGVVKKRAATYLPKIRLECTYGWITNSHATSWSWQAFTVSCVLTYHSGGSEVKALEGLPTEVGFEVVNLEDSEIFS